MAFFFQSRRTPPPPAPDESTLHLPLRTLEFPAFGREAVVEYLAPNGDEQAQRYETAARQAVANLEGRLSLLIPGSAVNRINAGAGGAPVAIDAETEAFLTLCDSVPFMTQGMLDPSVGPLVRLWDRVSAELAFPAADEVARARELVGWARLVRSAGAVGLPFPGMALDFSCVVFGLAADTLAQLASAHAIPGVLARVGPASRSAGQPPGKSAWQQTFPSPRAGEAPISVELFNRAVVLAGGLERAWTIGERRFAPVIDLKTGWPVANGVLQAVVLAPNAVQAGVIANTAFILGPAKGVDFIQSFPQCEGAIITAEARGQTRGFRETLGR